MDKRSFHSWARLGLPLILAAAALAAGVAVLEALWRSGNGAYMIWFWPLALLGLAGLWLLLRSRWAAWVSPQVFLAACAPVLILLLSAHILIPYLPGELSAPAAGRDGKADLSAELFTVDGRRVSVRDYPGKVVFLNFWATWCGPCRAEMPSMADLHHELADEGLSVIAVTDEDPDTVRAYLEDQPYPFTILLDPKGELFRKLRVRALPTTFVFDSQGKTAIEHEGAYLWSTPKLIEQFRRLLSE